MRELAASIGTIFCFSDEWRAAFRPDEGLAENGERAELGRIEVDGDAHIALEHMQEYERNRAMAAIAKLGGNVES